MQKGQGRTLRKASAPMLPGHPGGGEQGPGRASRRQYSTISRGFALDFVQAFKRPFKGLSKAFSGPLKVFKKAFKGLSTSLSQVV